MSEVFILAAQKKFRFASAKGPLTVEQLFDLPLTSASALSVDLDTVAKTVNAELKSVTEDSFVSTKVNPKKPELEAKLEVVKAVIAIKIEENKKRADKAERAARRQKLLDAINAAENDALSKAPLEELRKQLADLEQT